MKNKLAVITAHLEQIINGDAAPSFRGDEFKELVSAASALASAGSDPFSSAVFESIGRRTVVLMLDRLQSSMTAERTLSIMRGDNISPM